LRGASWVADHILKDQPDADVRVVAVWLAIRGDGQGRGDPHAILDDPRVTHLSDPDVDIGRWFGDRNRSLHAGSGVAWDAFMLFDADATFATLPDHLLTSGRTIIADHAKLAAAFTVTG
jgi:hypothetical protein